MINRLKEYIEKDEIYQDYKKGKLANASDFDNFCIQHCKDIEELLNENEELKKQLDKANDELHTLKNKYNIRLLNQISEDIEPDCEDYYLAEIEIKANKYDLIQSQQQEFLTYLEKEIVDCKAGSGQQYYAQEHLKMFKEIVGVKDGQ